MPRKSNFDHEEWSSRLNLKNDPLAFYTKLSSDLINDYFLSDNDQLELNKPEQFLNQYTIKSQYMFY